MEVVIEITKDAERIAKLNQPVQDIHHKLYPEKFKPFSYDGILESIANQLEKENWFCYIAKIGYEDVGYVLFFIKDFHDNPFRYAYKGIKIDQISIVEKYRRKGIGKLLMNKIEEKANEINATQIELTYWKKTQKQKSSMRKRASKQMLILS